MTVFSPTAQQKSAIDYNGNMVITACPGSGKTTVMKEKIRLITPELQAHQGVIAITFTKKASLELKKRCKENAHDTKSSFFGTIDSFCFSEIILPFLNRVWGGHPRDCRVVKQLPPDLALQLNEQYSSVSYRALLTDNGFKALYDQGYLWMNSFAAIAVHILTTSKGAKNYIKAKFTHVFIDEYQDSSQSQHDLFIKLMSFGLIAVAVGDTWQSIYEFRGGNPQLLNQLAHEDDNFQHFEVNKNHRCHPSISNYATRLLDPACELTPTDDIRVFRRSLDGNLKDSAHEVSSWLISYLETQGFGINKPSDIAILARSERSLKLISEGIHQAYRLYIDTPLDNSNAPCAEVFIDLLAYKFGSINTAQEVIDKHFEVSNYKINNLVSIRKKVRSLRTSDNIEQFIATICEISGFLDIYPIEESIEAVKQIVNTDVFKKQFMPVNDDEVQLMTLHKSKGLEFKLVVHFDLEEWSFPHMRAQGGDWNNVVFSNIQQDTNLHYVGITRAEECCILIKAGLRQNAQLQFRNCSPSYFLTLPQLENLYK